MNERPCRYVIYVSKPYLHSKPICFQFKQRWLIKLINFFFSRFILKCFLQRKQGENSKPTDPSKKCLKDQVLHSAAMRKYVYTCVPGLVYSECQVTLLILQIYPSMSVP